MLTSRFTNALTLAAALHKTQKRKGNGVPYISHLMAVSALVLEAGGNEDAAIAALLHDTLEDQGHKISLTEIAEMFGQPVAELVLACSDEVITQKGQPKGPWQPRKEAYIASIATKSRNAQLVSAADKLHNLRCALVDYEAEGEPFFDRFNASKQQTLWYYRELLASFEKSWPGNPLLTEMSRAVHTLHAMAGHPIAGN